MNRYPITGTCLAAVAAEQLGDRDAEGLALQVEQRHLDAGDRVGARCPLQLREYSSSRCTSHSTRSGSSPDEELRELAVDDRLDRREGRAGRLAEADEPLVGVDLDDQAGGRLADPSRPLERLPQWDANRRRLDACDPQEGRTVGRSAHGIVNHLGIVNNVVRAAGSADRSSTTSPMAQTVPVPRPKRRSPRRERGARDAARGDRRRTSYADGERLIEDRIARELNTSRGPVREALRQLEHEGLVVSYPYRGAVVLGVSDEEVHEVLIPIRLTLERFSFTKAAERMTDADFARAREGGLADGRGRRATSDLLRCVEADIRFHEFVLSRSGQPHTTQVWRSIAPRIRAYFFRFGRAVRPVPDRASSTASCSAALRSGDHEVLMAARRAAHHGPHAGPGRLMAELLRVENLRTWFRSGGRLDPGGRRGRLRARAPARRSASSASPAAASRSPRSRSCG